MKRADKISGAILMAAFVLVFYQSTKLDMMYRNSPGPGFFPLWLSLFALLAAGVIVVNAYRHPVSSDRPVKWPHGAGLRRIGITFIAFLLYAYLITVVGFIVSTTLFMLFMARILGSQRWVSSVAVSVLTAVGLFLVFKVWLQAELPTGLLGIP